MTSPPVTTLVWDIDDTLYDVGTGFTAHRNGDAVFDFMVEALGFETRAEAKALRDEYFAKTHATGKALAVAEADGRLPPGAHFELADLAEWWSSKLDFSMLQPDPVLTEALASCPLRHVCFTNSPRKYGIRCLEALGIRQFFKDADIFAVDDVLRLSGGACKPEAAAFQAVFDACGVRAEECVMLEDSMKNVRRRRPFDAALALSAFWAHPALASSRARHRCRRRRPALLRTAPARRARRPRRCGRPRRSACVLCW